MSVAEYTNSSLHPGIKVHTGLADRMLLRACTHTHMCCEHPNSQGLQGFGRPTATESMRTENSRRISQYRVASRARVTKVWPTKCGLEHTHTHVSCHGVVDSLLLRAYTCVSQKKSVEVCTRGPRVARVLSARTCELQNKQIQRCTRGSRVTKVWPTKCCCERTHVCCRINPVKVAQRDQRLHGFGRPTAAVSIHMCVAGNISSAKGQG